MVIRRTVAIRACKLELDVDLMLPDRNTTDAAGSINAGAAPSSGRQSVRQVGGVDQSARFCLHDAIGGRLNAISRMPEMILSVTVLPPFTIHHDSPLGPTHDVSASD
jgi:hypothetical protein